MSSRAAPVALVAGIGVLAALATAPMSAIAGDSSARPTLPGTVAASGGAASAAAALRFEPNVGQAPAPVRYLARGPAQTAWLGPTGISVATASAASARAVQSPPRTAHTRPRAPEDPLRLDFVGAAPAARPVPTGPLSGVSNYLIGSDPAGWRTGVRSWSGLRFVNVYPGIDVRYTAGTDHHLRFDVVVAPGADPSRLRLRFPGTATLAVDGSGDLVVRSGSAPATRLQRPTTFQPDQRVDPAIDPTRLGLRPAAETARRVVASSFRIRGRDVTVALGGYDRSRPLVIDPTIVYSTPFPGAVEDLAVDRTGAVYVASTAVSARAPTDRLGPADGNDAVVAKVDRTGSALAWITYVGGSSYDSVAALSVDADGGVLLTGSTSSTDFPLRRATRSEPAGSFVAALSRTGTGLDFASYIGSGNSYAVDVAAGPESRAVVLLASDAAGLPLSGPGARPFRGGYDAYLTGLDLHAGRVAFGGYVGGSQPEYPAAIAVGEDGTSYLTGSTDSSDFPTAHAVQGHPGGGSDGFLAAVDPLGRLVTGTYLGGSESDTPNDLAVSGAAVLVAGGTYSGDFPTRKAAQGRSGGYEDAFLTRYGAGGRSVSTSTYLGGPGFDQADGVAVGPDGTAYLAGFGAGGFPAVSPLPGQRGPLFVAALGADGRVRRATLLGTAAEGNGHVSAIAADPLGQVYVGGSADPGSMPTIHPLPFGGGGDFLMRLQLLPPAGPTCAGARVTLGGTDGADRLTGTSGADVIDARGGADLVDGRGGDDVICGGPGADRLLGGDGRDVLRGDDDADVLDGGSGADAIDGGGGSDRVSGGEGDDNLEGGPAADAIDGAGGRDVLAGGDGNDELLGGPGDDTMAGGADRDQCLGGTGRADTAVDCEIARCPLCWQPAAAPPIAGEAVLYDVAGSGRDSAWAVGAAQTAGGAVRALVEHYDGTSWKVVPVTTPGADSQLLAVATDGADVWAVGASFDQAGAGTPLVLHRTGGTWRALPPPSAAGGLSGVTARAGRVWVSGAGSGPLVARWTGATWSRLPNPPNTDVADDVAADGPASVWTAGVRFVDSVDGMAATTLHWTGTAWQSSPLGPAPQTYVDQVIGDVSLIPGLGIRVTGSSGDFRGGFRESYVAAPADPAANRTLRGFDAQEFAGSSTAAWLVGSTATGEYYEPGPQTPAAYAWDGAFHQARFGSFGTAAALFGTDVFPDGGAWAVGGYRDAAGRHALILEHRPG